MKGSAGIRVKDNKTENGRQTGFTFLDVGGALENRSLGIPQGDAWLVQERGKPQNGEND